MLSKLFSGDFPRSKVLAGLLIVIVVGLLAQPMLSNNVRLFTSFGTIAIFIIVVAAYDLMLGYTHVVSFAHTIFFGFGAYGIAIATNQLGASYSALLIGLSLGLLASLVLAILLGLLSLRVKTIFFALVSLAVAFALMSLVTKLYFITGGEDGLRVKLPTLLGPSFKFSLGLSDKQFNGRHIVYYICVTFSLITFFALLRMVNSPFGRVLKAIRENEDRAQSLGYKTIYYKTFAVIVSGWLTCIAGALFALFNRYVDPTNTLDFRLMIFILLMSVIGGMGSIYGAVIGVTIFLLAQNYLQDGLQLIQANLPEPSLLANLLSPDHWLLWFGLLFILSVYFFPKGVVGKLRE